MKNNICIKQDGLTFVEIMLMLTVVGLVSGSALKAMEMENIAQVRAIADHNSNVQAAYYGFIDRYHAIPGDMPEEKTNAFSKNIIPGGDGNKRINKGDFREASLVWQHLSISKFISSDEFGYEFDKDFFSNLSASFLGNNPQGFAVSDETYLKHIYAPTNIFGGRVLLGVTDSFMRHERIKGNVERLGFILGRDIPVAVIAELDLKLDDGKPLSGVLRGAALSSESDFGSVSEQASDCIDSKSLWNTAQNIFDCNAIYLY